MIRRLVLFCATLLIAGPAVAAPKCLARMDTAGLGIALPHLAADLAARRVPVIVAIGSSSTQGVGASRPDRSYPARLAIELRQRHGIATRVINKGIGGESTAETLRRSRPTSPPIGRLW
jgi:acyl-CoA thioesterase-1